MKDSHKKAHYLLLGLTTAIFISAQSGARAMDVHPTLMVVNFQAEPQNSQIEHELYLRVGEYDSNGITRSFTVPQLKLNWPAHRSNRVDNLQIWGGALSDGQATSLVVSVMEHNAPPWGTDSLIGVLNLKIKNEQGKLITKWTIPNTNEERKNNSTSPLAKQVHFNSDETHYTVDFVLRTDLEQKLPPKVPRLLTPVNSK